MYCWVHSLYAMRVMCVWAMWDVKITLYTKGDENRHTDLTRLWLSMILFKSSTHAGGGTMLSITQHKLLLNYSWKLINKKNVQILWFSLIWWKWAVQYFAATATWVDRQSSRSPVTRHLRGSVAVSSCADGGPAELWLGVLRLVQTS